MSNEYFEFQQFTVRQHRCAMKVGTDGTLLGAWAEAPYGECRMLDIGTGTGLIALMMAQRFPEAFITGIDIDENAVLQAQENVATSPFSDRIDILHCDLADFHPNGLFQAIVSNPPYFIDALTCPDEQRTTARHTTSLSYETLMKSAFRLLANDGWLSIVVPSENQKKIESVASLEGFFVSRICHVKTTPRKLPKRQMIEFRKIPVKEIIIEEGIIEDSPNVRSTWYKHLTQEFYIK